MKKIISPLTISKNHDKIRMIMYTNYEPHKSPSTTTWRKPMSKANWKANLNPKASTISTSTLKLQQYQKIDHWFGTTESKCVWIRIKSRHNFQLHFNRTFCYFERVSNTNLRYHGKWQNETPSMLNNHICAQIFTWILMEKEILLTMLPQSEVKHIN